MYIENIVNRILKKIYLIGFSNFESFRFFFYIYIQGLQHSEGFASRRRGQESRSSLPFGMLIFPRYYTHSI